MRRVVAVTQTAEKLRVKLKRLLRDSLTTPRLQREEATVNLKLTGGVKSDPA